MIRPISKFLFLFSVQAMSLTFEVHWNFEDIIEKHLVMKCNKNESYCYIVCENISECRLEEKECLNCIGEDLFFVNFFMRLDKLDFSTYKKVGKESKMLYLNFLFNYSFNRIFIDRESMYNVAYSHESKKFLQKFRLICPSGENYEALIVLRVREGKRKIESLICQSLLDKSTQIYLPDRLYNDFNN